MAMSAELIVDPQVVLSKSGDMKSIRTQLSRIMQDVIAKFQNLRTVFDSEEAIDFQTRFNKIHTDIEEMLHIVDEYTYDLDEIATNYINTNRGIKAISEQLPGNTFGGQ